MIKNTATYFVIDEQSDYDLGPTGLKPLNCYEAFIYNRDHEIIDVVAAMNEEQLRSRIVTLYPGLVREMSNHIWPKWNERQ